MALLSTRESSKLNTIIFLLLLELILFIVYIWNHAEKPQSGCHKNEDSKSPSDSTEYPNKDPMKFTIQNLVHAPSNILNTTPHPEQKLNQTSQQTDCGPLPTDKELYTLPHNILSQRYHSYVNAIQVHCAHTVRHGNVGDGGWDVCLDPPFKITAPCTVYSFGIKDDWSFDDSITANYNCQLHAYDPSVNFGDHDRKPNLHFHRTGLGSYDGSNERGWRMLTFSSMLKENGHTEVAVDVLKMDIEGSEWASLPQMLTSGSLNNVRQMCFEVHVRIGSEPEPSTDIYIRGIKLFKDLYRAGFRIFKTHKNMDAKFNSRHGFLRTGCHEIYMVNTKVKSIGCE